MLSVRKREELPLKAVTAEFLSRSDLLIEDADRKKERREKREERRERRERIEKREERREKRENREENKLPLKAVTILRKQIFAVEQGISQ
jgi:hypothetical protein